MADDRIEGRPWSWRQLLPWVELFRGFRVAIGLRKLALAAAGILTMAVVWEILAAIFFSFYQNGYPDYQSYAGHAATIQDEKERLAAQWKEFRRDRDNWNLMLETAGALHSQQGGEGYAPQDYIDAGDLADSPEQYDQINAFLTTPAGKKPDDSRGDALLDHIARRHKVTPSDIRELAEYLGAPADIKDPEVAAALRLARAKALVVSKRVTKPAGTLSTWPWLEDRGPNQFLMVTGQAGVPWEAGHFWDWLLTRQFPVLIEPLVKFLRPVLYFFSPRAGWVARLYFLLVILATLAIWAFFGAAITRMAAVEVARHENISALDALRYVCRRYFWSYLMAPLWPLILMAGLVVLLFIYGLVQMIPYVGDIVIDGLFWPIALLLGAGLACLLVGLVTWPLMTVTISTEDEEGLNAFGRAYSYLIQAPWQYAWYTLVALAYGAVLVFFVGLMGSLVVYLAKWGVTEGSLAESREPTRLFVYAPTSFQWRHLLLEGATIDKGPVKGPVVGQGEIDETRLNAYVAQDLGWQNQVGAVLISIWLGAFFLLVLGFGYSYFWTASTIIYLLLRRHVDDAEMDEVYFEEDEEEFGPVPAAPPKAPAPPLAPGTTMVEAPALRVSSPPAATGAPPPQPAPEAPHTATATVTPPPVPPEAPPGDGSPPPGGPAPA